MSRIKCRVFREGRIGDKLDSYKPMLFYKAKITRNELHYSKPTFLYNAGFPLFFLEFHYDIVI